MNVSKCALITGVTGQDGSYLAELLLSKGYEVHGIGRRNIDNIVTNNRYLHALIKTDSRFFFHKCAIEDTIELSVLIAKISPDEIYHLAGQSDVARSIEDPIHTCNLSGFGVLKFLELIRKLRKSPKFFHASSSEIFGNPSIVPQEESTAHVPTSPYGCAKSFATNVVRMYRDRYSLFAVNGILYNHESPRRGINFITRKITHSAAAIRLGVQNELIIGDMSSKRDWGYAPDYVEGMWLSLQASEPDDYVFATGELNSVHDVIRIAFATAGLDFRKAVRSDIAFIRSADSRNLVGNANKALLKLGWQPKKTFSKMIEEMTLHDIKSLNTPP
jgi:GDPmannose 4,6-dehydratase